MTTPEKTQRPRRVFSAQEKCQVVLSIWAGRRKPSAVSREMKVNWGVVNSWEKRAVQGVLKGLGSKEEVPVGHGELGDRLEKLLQVPEKPAGEKKDVEMK